MHLKMAEALGTVHMCRKGLLQSSLWPIGPKLIFDQMAAWVSGIMDMSLYEWQVSTKKSWTEWSVNTFHPHWVL
jgi:hypothetical protein